jgi:hypothetical protein
MSDLFDKVEHEHFGKDEFDDAVARIARIAQAFGLADFDAYTAPSPPQGECRRNAARRRINRR